MKKIVEEFDWHSGFGITAPLGGKKIVRSLCASSDNLGKFIRASNKSNFLIHKSSKALWRFSDDGKTIEPAFEEDVLTQEKV